MTVSNLGTGSYVTGAQQMPGSFPSGFAMGFSYSSSPGWGGHVLTQIPARCAWERTLAQAHTEAEIETFQPTPP